MATQVKPLREPRVLSGRSMTGPTVADLIRRLGRIDPARILLTPTPGTATIADVARYECELIDGTLVRKAMGFREAHLASYIARLLGNFAESHQIGTVVGADGFLKMVGGNSRAPDASYFAFASLPGGKLPGDPVPDLAPDLAIEVISPGNTVAEMKRKRKEYFVSGVKMVWLVYPMKRTVVVYTKDDKGTTLHPGDSVDGGAVVPGFNLPLAKVFAQLDL